ncbi:MAG: NAD(P)/FAD-dependent oxidoreductase [Ilumatobacteraceae bacterium]|nr:NAD(P)/FAD-dependent oxidoreductase [Ilumatobacteraceae bacterium]
MTTYDAVVVGSGPNGLVAAIEIARAGRSVLVVEGAPIVGGGLRTEELTAPGYRHDVCSSIHPLGVASPAMRGLGLEEHGVRWVQPDAPLAHPLPDGRAAILERSLAATADRLGPDGGRWTRLLRTVTRPGPTLVDALLDPLSVPRHPIDLARYGVVGIRGAQSVAAGFEGAEAAALLAGLAGHSIQRLDAPATAGFGLLLGGLAHLVGWPLAAGGSQTIADALVAILRSHGGEVVTDRWIASVDDLPPSRVVLADTSPGALVGILGDRLPSRYVSRVGRFRHGPGVFKVDWALDGPVPWSHPEVSRAATVHVGGTLGEIVAAEAEVAAGRHPERPFVLVAQTSLFDASRAPTGRHTLWGYCHVPNGSTVDMTDRIEAQIERFAPGFRDRIVARHAMDTTAVEAHDPNYVGGDINGGAADLRQIALRPVPSLRPWIVPVDGWYLCSSSTPPGGGVHGMCGWRAARSALGRELR